MYERVADDANGNHIWEFFITRRTNDSGWLPAGATPNHAIRWTGTQWEDHDTTGSYTYPTSVTLNGTTVELYDNNTLLGTFTHPYTSGSVGGTSTESVEPSGSITVVNDVLTWTIDGTSPTGTDYKLFRDSTEVMSTIGHTNGSLTSSTISNPAAGLWQLKKGSQGQFATFNLTSAVNVGNYTRKVFCNFW